MTSPHSALSSLCPTPAAPAQPLSLPAALSQAQRALDRIVLGKPLQIRLSLACLLARGHLLLEDLPGVGKTTLAHALARTLGLQYQRVQFTSDLLPADLIGVSIYLKEKGAFEFHPGPLFAQVVLADEINRATPKAQSALLEAMAEGQVTHDGATYPLPEPFFVIATQNPLNQIGTHPLPESQLDRFTMRLSLGYPDQRSERALYLGGGAAQDIEPALTAAQVVALQAATDAVHVAPALVDYVLALVNATRTDAQVQMGLSPRAGLALLAAARAWALIDGRDAVLPEDVQAVFNAVAAHRLLPTGGTLSATALAQRLLDTVAIP